MFPECFCGPFFPSINCEVSTNTTIHFVLSDPGLGRNSKENQSWIFIGRTDAEVATRCEELTHWKRPWCWEGLKVGGEGDDRGWDGWMASPTQWTRVWANSGGWWWTGKLGVLQSMGSQRVRHDWATEQQHHSEVDIRGILVSLLAPCVSLTLVPNLRSLFACYLKPWGHVLYHETLTTQTFSHWTLKQHFLVKARGFPWTLVPWRLVHLPWGVCVELEAPRDRAFAPLLWGILPSLLLRGLALGAQSALPLLGI